MIADLDFSILKRAGVSQGLFADLCQVSRETANGWVNGRSKPAKDRRSNVTKILRALDLAVQRGNLPVDSRSVTAARVLNTIISKHVKG